MNRLTLWMSGLAAAVLLMVLGGSAYSQVEELKQPRTLGNHAAMHLYYYAPKTLEITYVDSYLFADEDACKAAIPRALLVASPHAGAGDLVNAQCVEMHPPEAISNPQEPGVSDL